MLPDKPIDVKLTGYFSIQAHGALSLLNRQGNSDREASKKSSFHTKLNCFLASSGLIEKTPMRLRRTTINENGKDCYFQVRRVKRTLLKKYLFRYQSGSSTRFIAKGRGPIHCARLSSYLKNLLRLENVKIYVEEDNEGR